MTRKKVAWYKVTKQMLVILLMASVSITCLAQFAGGNGSSQNPYQVEAPEHLDAVRNYLGAVNRRTWFIQTRDIDLDVPPWNEGRGWSPIGTSAFNNQFMGKYDGNGYVITGLTINRDSPGQGLFGFVSDGAVLENIGLLNVSLTGVGNMSGALAGNATASTENNVRIVNCYVSGGIVSSVSDSQNNYVGGLLGVARGNAAGFFPIPATIINCWSNVEVVLQGSWGGGLVGQLGVFGSMRGCFSLGSVTATGNNRHRIGGLLGENNQGMIFRENYSHSSVTAPAGVEHVGGLIGRNDARGSVDDCYSIGLITAGDNNVGGLIGSNTGEVNNSYWNTETSGRDASAGGRSANSEQMTYPYQDTYVGWDFDDMWVHDDEHVYNNGYPYLFYQEFPDLDPPVLTIDIIIIDETEHVRIEWEHVPGANSYHIYSSDDIRSQDWGDPVAIVAEAHFLQPVNPEERNRYYYVTSSADEAP